MVIGSDPVGGEDGSTPFWVWIIIAIVLICLLGAIVAFVFYRRRRTAAQTEASDDVDGDGDGSTIKYEPAPDIEETKTHLTQPTTSGVIYSALP